MRTKLKLIPVLTLALFAASAATAEEAPTAAKAAMAPMSWPLQPGDSVRSLAKRVYPRDRHMQQHFVKEVMRLNRETLQGYTPAKPVQDTLPIHFPDLKALSRYAAPQPKRGAAPALQESSAVDTKLQADYERQMARNTALKRQQAELDQRMARLQAEIESLQKELAPSSAEGK